MNNIIVISGPSGSGKSTLISMLLDDFPQLTFSVSHTTRAPRGTETDGEDYHFTTDEVFKRMIETEEFVEWARVHDKYYGTSLQEVKEKSSGSQFLVLDIDVQGARIVKKKLPDALFILVTPPSISELETRLVKREKVITDQFLRRLKVARDELNHYDIYDYIIINDDLNDSYRILKSIFIANKNTTAQNLERLKKIIQEK